MKKTKIQDKITFAQKYKMENCGHRIIVSLGTKDSVTRLYHHGDEVVKKGEEYSKEESRAFGGCPRPGEVGCERYFTTVYN